MCSLHLTHPSAYTLGAVGKCAVPGEQLGVSEFLLEPRFGPTTSDYKFNALFTRPRLPLDKLLPFDLSILILDKLYMNL